jgi:cytochrome c-type biogenesis protein CcmH/NrfF
LTTFWIVPLVVTTVGLLLVAGFARRLTEEVAGLRRSLARLDDLRPAYVELRTELDHLRRR